MLDDFNCKINCCKEKDRNNIKWTKVFLNIYLSISICDVEDHYIYSNLIIHSLHNYTIKNINVLEI